MRINAAPLVSLDTETTGLDPMQAQLVGIAFSVEPHQARLSAAWRTGMRVPRSNCRIDLVLDKLRPWLDESRQIKSGAESQVRQAHFCQSWHCLERYRP